MTSSEFQYLLSTVSFDTLPGEAAHQVLSPMTSEVRSVAFKKNTAPRLSAVSLLLYNKNEEPHFVLTKRQVYKGAHSGQISFPGGKQEDVDDTHLDTALRETHEEVGVHPTELNLIGQLTPTYIPPSGFLVYPFVVQALNEPSFFAEEKEVKEIIEVKVKDLVHPDSLQTTIMDFGNGVNKVKVPYFNLNGEIVWGATAMILNEFREIIVANNSLGPVK